MTEKPEIAENAGQPVVPTPEATSGAPTSFWDSAISAHQATPKQAYEMPVVEESTEAATDSQATIEQDKPQGEKWTKSRIHAEAKMHVAMFDFAASRGLAVYSGEKPDLFKSTPDEKVELTDALAEWYETMDVPPKIPPWIFVLFTAFLIYAPKVGDARKARQLKKAKAKKTADEVKKDRFAEPIPFTVVKENSNDGKKTDTPVATTNG